MPRRNRIAYDGAWYHIFNRASGRKTIHFTQADYEYFLYLMEEITRIYKVEIHAYCVMKNHYHILIHTPHGNISEAMWYFGRHFARYINKNIHSDGPVFRRRFNDVLIELDSKLLYTCRYIHLNPVEAGIVEFPEDYEWSSYTAYMNPGIAPAFLHTDFIFKYFLREHELFEFTNLGLDEETKNFYSRKHVPSIYGSKEFVLSHK